MTAPTPDPPRRSPWLLAIAIPAAAFGVATCVSGGRVIFGPDSARIAAGHYVPFVVGFNFLAGFAYVAAAAGIALARRGSALLSLGIALATLIVGVAFAAHVLGGGAWEPRTAQAMALRAVTWTAIAAWACRRFGCRRQQSSR